MTLLAESLIRDIPDYPKLGILFRDITPALKNSDALREIIMALASWGDTKKPDYIVGIESRGFILGTPLAVAMGIGFVPVRKAGKLPYDVIKQDYALEYGTATIEIHKDAIEPGARVLVIDDLLATGGTALAACELVKQVGGHIVGIGFMVELLGLDGRAGLSAYDVHSLISYD